jgi:hypothetical protein
MQNSHTRNQQYLYRQEGLGLFLAIFLLFFTQFSAQAQFFKQKGNSNSGRYTENVSYNLQREKRRLTRPVNFGFYLAGLGTRLSPKYTPTFAQSNDPAGIININAKNSGGFGIGFYSSYRLSEFFDLRVHTQATFYEQQLEYTFADGEIEAKLIEGSSFEIPILIKYRAQLRGNKGMYMIAGITPGFALSAQKEERDAILTTSTNLSIEYGFGLDVFFTYFKFAPEIRFSHGLNNVLNKNEINSFNNPLEKLNTHRVILFLHFGG